MSAFADAIAAGLQTVAAVAGVSIVYSRGAGSVALVAVPARTNEPLDESGVAIKTRDWIIKAAELVIETQITPRRGDLITYGGKTYEVVAQADEKCYRACDPAETRIRVHTLQKYVA